MSDEEFRITTASALARIETLLEGLGSHVARECPARELRIRALENWRTYIAGAAALAGIAWAVVRVALRGTTAKPSR